MISAKNISIKFKDGVKDRVIISNASFSILDNECTFILGPSGSGKSSLLYVLSLLRAPSSGSVVLNNQIITDSKDKTGIRYNNFGFVFQHNFLISYLNVIDNVCVANREYNLEKKAKELLDRLGIAHLMNKKPFMLSGGERQRVAIARAIIKKPKVLFADEPTASLDYKTAKEVMGIFSELNKNTIIICATHDLGIIPEKSRKLYLKDGQITEGR